MKATLKRFYSSEKYQGATCIVVATEGLDELTGLVISTSKVFILAGNFYLKNLIGKEVVLTLTKSEKLGFEVCTGIALPVETVEAEELSLKKMGL